MPLTITTIPFGAALASSAVNTPLNQIKTFVDGLETSLNTETSTRTTAIANVLAGNTSFTQISVGTDTTLTIASDAVTVTRTRHLIDTEGSAASDDLATINGGVEGDLLILQSVDAGRVVTVKHNTGNIFLFAAQDVQLSNPRQALILLWDGTRWCQMASQAGTITLREQVGAIAVPVSEFIVPRNSIVTGTPNRLALMANLAQRNYFAVRAAAATVQTDMIAAVTTTGTLAANNQSDSTYISMTTGGAAGNIAGFISATFNLVRRSHNPVFEAVVRTGASVADLRLWIGLFSAAPTNVDDLAGATQGIAFRFSAPAGDTGWRGVCDDGTTASVSTNLMSVAADTRYLLRIRVDSTASIAHFSINNGVETAISTNLPAEATELGIGVYVITNIASARVLNFSRMTVAYD